MDDTRARVLLVDDDDGFRVGVRLALESDGHEVREHAAARPVIAALAAADPDVVLVDLRLPDLDGLAVLDHVRRADPELPVVLISGLADIATAVQAIRQGAYDFLEKPFARERLLTLVRRAVQQRRLARDYARLRAGFSASAGLASVLAGQSEAMRTLRETLLRIAPTPVDVLLVGETGTGKELAARALHDFSGRRGPFVALNCAAVPEALFESELFGHEAGAYTGAARTRVGQIEHADGGTLFLDEIDALPPSQQPKLLRVLQQREVTRVGSNTPRAVDVRVVAATHADLRETGTTPGAPARDAFRSDLYWRLATVVLALPPLRERPADVPLLFEHFRAAAVLRFGREAPAADGGLLERLLAHPWPGNVRELKAAAERHVLGLPALPGAGDDTPRTLQQSLEAVEAVLVGDALARHGGKVDVAAEELGLSVATLYRKLKQHGLRREDPAGAA